MTAIIDDWGQNEVYDRRTRRPSRRSYGWPSEEREPVQEPARRTTREHEQRGLAVWVHRNDLGSRLARPTVEDLERQLRGRLP